MSPTDDRRELGRLGEDLACEHLASQGYSIVERNWRSSRGEIDIVVVKDDLTAFVEVKARRSGAFGTPEEAVTPRKAGRLRRLAGEFLSERGGTGDIRFDVVSVMLDSGGHLVSLEHIPDAF